jgi:hypothetical protein
MQFGDVLVLPRLGFKWVIVRQLIFLLFFQLTNSLRPFPFKPGRSLTYDSRSDKVPRSFLREPPLGRFLAPMKALPAGPPYLINHTLLELDLTDHRRALTHLAIHPHHLATGLTRLLSTGYNILRSEGGKAKRISPFNFPLSLHFLLPTISFLLSSRDTQLVRRKVQERFKTGGTLF